MHSVLIILRLLLLEVAQMKDNVYELLFIICMHKLPVYMVIYMFVLFKLYYRKPW